MNLTSDDLQVLTEALDAWVLKDSAGEMLGDLVGSMLGDQLKAEGRQKVADEKAQRAAEKQTRKERAILLQAKLIQMKDGLVGESVAASLAQDPA